MWDYPLTKMPDPTTEDAFCHWEALFYYGCGPDGIEVDKIEAQANAIGFASYDATLGRNDYV